VFLTLLSSQTMDVSEIKLAQLLWTLFMYSRKQERASYGSR